MHGVSSSSMAADPERPQKRRRMAAPPSSPIPDDLLFSEVLPRLPVQSLLRFKSASRAWRAAIEAPAVSRRHLAMSRARKQPPTLLLIPRDDFHAEATAKSEVVGFYRLLMGEAEAQAELVFEKAWPGGVTHTLVATHCDGLVALATTTGDVFVCNPATREFVALPPGTRSVRGVKGLGAPAAALGYDASRGRYVVARYFYREFQEAVDVGTGECCVVSYDIGHEVFTLGDGGSGGGWELTDAPPCPIAATARPICTREAFYWYAEQPGQKQNTLMRFDLRDRKFDVVPCPPGTAFDFAVDHVTDLDGRLCYVHPAATDEGSGSDSDLETTAFDVWLADEGPRPEWSLRCRFDLDDDMLGGEALLPVAAAGDETLIAIDYKKLFSYNARVKSLRLVVDMEEELEYRRLDGSTYEDGELLQHHVVPYVESLVPIGAVANKHA